MKRFQTRSPVPAPCRGASAAIGNFDGVHRGHMAVIDLARRTGAPLGIVTFEPHPRAFFAPEAAPFRLTSAETRAARLERLGVDCLFELPFDAALAGLSARAFAEEILAGQLGLSHVVTGPDFRFGKGREGDVDTLRQLGAELGFDVTVAGETLCPDGSRVSSTAIRDALSAGDPQRVAALLGHWHRIDGPVIHGEKRGRVLGFPTANMSIDGLHPPRHGVYAVQVMVKDGPHAGAYHGAASIGVRPMFGENRANLETYLLDFKGDLYGATLSVGLIAFLRPELTFESVDALTEQMGRDVAAARVALAAADV